jgi:hypothetical protein
VFRGDGMNQQGERKSLLFVNKKKQKNFVRLEPALSTSVSHMEKVFLLLFFQKKKTLAFHLTAFP